MSEARSHWGLACTDGGKFYICEDDDTQFVGCCLNDPCGKNNGTCPDGDLRATTFEPDNYDSLPGQDCDNSQGTDNFYTCASTSPPFFGCCSQNACGSGCPRDRLVPAKLSSIEKNRLDFLEPRAASSSTASSTSATASSSSAADSNDDSGLSTGATAGIAVGAAVGGLLVLGLLAWLFWWKPRQKKKYEQAPQTAPGVSSPGPTMNEYPQSPMSGPIHQGTFPAQSPMSGYQRKNVPKTHCLFKYSPILETYSGSPGLVDPRQSGMSSPDQFQKYSPQFSQNERPQSYGQFSDNGHSPGVPPYQQQYQQPYQQPYQQQYQQPHMVPVQEMDGTAVVRSEMDAGTDHNASQQPQGLNITK